MIFNGIIDIIGLVFAGITCICKVIDTVSNEKRHKKN